MDTITLAAGESREFTISAGTMLSVSPVDDLSTLEYWWIASGNDDIRGGGVEGGDLILLGPYIADARVRIECKAGNVSVGNSNSITQEPQSINPFVGGMIPAQLDAIGALTSESTAADIVAALQAG